MARLEGRHASRRQDGCLIIIPAVMAVVIPAVVVAIIVVAVFNDHHLVDVDNRGRSRDGRRGRSGGVRAGGRQPGQTDGCRAKEQEVFHRMGRIEHSKSVLILVMHVVMMVVMVVMVRFMSRGGGRRLGRFLRIGGSGTESDQTSDDEADSN